jgi:putative tryptophan/tyrosine transport system substrate-binding protein
MPLPALVSLRRFARWSRRGLGWFCLAGMLVAGGCGSRHDASPVAVFASPDSPRLRQVLASLKEGLAPSRLQVACVPEFGAAADQALKRIRAQDPPLLVVLGSPALIRVAPAEKRIPVVFAMVASPYVTGAADDPRHPDLHQKNITGIASPPPVAPALQQGSHLLGSGAWGMLYDPGEGQEVEVAGVFTRLAPMYGLTPLTEPSGSAAADLPALQKLVARGAQVLYIPPTASAARYASTLLAWGRERRIKVVSSLADPDHKGAILWVALDYRALGKEAAALAKRLLAGANPENIPIAESQPLRVEADEGLIRYWSGYPGVSRIPDGTPIK